MPSKAILAIDNSSDFLNLALGIEGRFLEERHARNTRPSSEALPERVHELLERHGLIESDLCLLVVTIGPGSFTGTRVALSFCKGLARGLDIPVTGVPTLDALAFPLVFLEGHYLLPLIDAKKGEVFTALFHASGGKLERVIDYRAVRPGDVPQLTRTPCVCFGSGARLCSEALERMADVTLIHEGFSRITGEALLRLGLSIPPAAHPGSLRPMYGRKSEAELKFDVTVD